MGNMSSNNEAKLLKMSGISVSVYNIQKLKNKSEVFDFTIVGKSLWKPINKSSGLTEKQVIYKVNSMDVFGKHKYYSRYLVEKLYQRAIHNMNKCNYELMPITSFVDFISESNIIIHDTKFNDWKERGFAAKSWIILNPGSIYWSVYHNLI